MRKLLKYLRTKGDAGLSLIELIISMAILAVVGIAIGGAMYVSSKSYTRGSTEVNVQEEAQVASNLICDWLVDATSVTPGNGQVTLADDCSNDITIVHPDGNNGTVTIRVFLDGIKLKYSAEKKITADDGSVTTENSSGILADNVYNAVFNSTFDSDRNVKFSMDFKVNERNFNAVTDSTSRNHSFVSTGGSSTTSNLYILPDKVYSLGGDEYQVVLEPGQRQNSSGGYDASYNFDFTVYGFDEHTNVLMNGSSNQTQTLGGVTLTYSQISGTNQFNVKCQSTDSASGDQVFTFKAVNDTDPSICHVITVHVSIRRATKFEFGYNAGTFKTSGDEGKSGSTYYATIDLGVTYGSQLNAYFDKNGNYKNPYVVKFFYREKNGTSFTAIDPATYFDDLVITDGSAGGAANISFKLKNDISKDIYIVAVAAHSGSLNALGNANANVTFSNYTASPAYAANRVAAAKSGSFTYGPSGNAYYGVLKITATSPHNDDFTLPNPSSIRRGIPSFEIARLTDTGYNTLSAAVLSHCQSHYSDQFPTNHGYKFQSVVWYRAKGDTNWSFYVMHCPAQLTNMKDHETTQFQNANESFIFEADKSYDYYVAYYAYAPNGDEVKVLKSDINQVPASVPYVYDPTDQKFKMETFDSDSPMIFDESQYKSTNNYKDYDFYVYFSNMTSANAEDFHITWTVEKYDVSSGQWKPDNNIIVWKQGLETTSQLVNSARDSWGIGAAGDGSIYHTGSSNSINRIVLGGADFTDGTSLLIGPYNENRYPDANMSVAQLRIDKSYISSSYYGQYRLSFGGHNSYQAPTNLNSGSIGYNGSCGSVSGRHTVDCDLTGTSVNGAEYGYIYFNIQA